MRKKTTNIGGQAVMEGVMMRGAKSMATAVRDADGIIRIESKRIVTPKTKCKILGFPLIRGVVSFIQSLVGGTKVLMRSAEVFGDGEPSKFEKWCSEKLKINLMSVVIFFSLLIGFALAVFLFMWLPVYVRTLFEKWFNVTFSLWAKNFIEGGLKLLIFILYLVLCSLIKDVKRTFMYHGAEHKTISCYESGLELTTENAKTCTRVHDRCGTTFMVFVILISIIVFALFESLVGSEIEGILRVLCKIALLPLTAGLSYELLKGLAKTKCFIFYPLKVPGLLLQRITTKEPTEDMLEVAINAFNEVLKMEQDETVKEQTFIISESCDKLTERVKAELKENGIEEIAESEWIVSIICGISRDEVYSKKIITPKYVEKVNETVKERISGRPLWYCIGNVDFYGNIINVDERVLIPRPETELLVENAIKYCKKDTNVLDLCTGSGAIAITVKKETEAKVYASDISEEALILAKENAKSNGVSIDFIKSDMLKEIDKVFDVIVCNPPYIKSADIKSLQKEVKDFEPKIALDGGEDGLDFYRVIAKDCYLHLCDGGKLLLECGINQSKDVKDLLKDYKNIEVIKDYEGIERIIKAEK